MQDKRDIYDSLPAAGKVWSFLFTGAFLLSIVMSLTVVPLILHGHGLPFDHGKRIYWHDINTHHGRWQAQVTQTESAVLTTCQVLPWIAIGSLVAMLICIQRSENP